MTDETFDWSDPNNVRVANEVLDELIALTKEATMIDDELPTAVESSGSVGLLDDLAAHFRRYIAMPDPEDYKLLALWTVSTHMANELYTTARLLIDSTMPGSGKTTVLEHLAHLCHQPVQAASISSPALLVRLLQHGVRTLLIDEVDRSLNPKKPGVEDLIGIINSGYKRGATRPVLVPAKGGNWEVREMPTFCPVAMAGNSPHLPDDTKSRSIRILLMPDLDGTIDDSDWEKIDTDVEQLRDKIIAFANEHRATIGQDVDLPDGCVGRAKEKWRPLKRVAVAAGGQWPKIADQLIRRGLDEDDHERDAGLRALPPGMVLMTDLHTIWKELDDFVPTKDLVSKLVIHNPEYWGLASAYGKALTDTRFGRMVIQASKITSQRPGGRGPRGYAKDQFNQVWHRLGIGRSKPGAPGEPGAPGANEQLDLRQVHRLNQVHRVETDPVTPGAVPGSTPPSPSSMPTSGSHPALITGRRQRTRGKHRCPCGGLAPARTDTGMCDLCTARQQTTESAS
ncbi:DUF3631 domain-containing protein [Mycolicibacterium sp. NCC-Tsukiji]|uniref:DUF3631 domain-containing protein n=1 Tax=Mycolicibacterium sp. NCC-Tsukiji TaxID=2185272 RepID=UPI000ED14ED6|nr:DUF3631 domain-containing protein [Mycolicibacterium sp. NCC-Tsukiji]GCA98579.1 hypothetical protein NCCNTM_22140 [Mycolicibacterium sp. NCC-Tsukiji]